MGCATTAQIPPSATMAAIISRSPAVRDRSASARLSDRFSASVSDAIAA
jgi:hypothetical protein